MPADVDAEAWCDDIIVEDSDSMENCNGMVTRDGPDLPRKPLDLKT